MSYVIILHDVILLQKNKKILQLKFETGIFFYFFVIILHHVILLQKNKKILQLKFFLLQNM